jgi:nicotinamide phosphoribosyltransferase
MGFVQFQGHDFSMRGMACLEAAELSGSGHLLSFVGTDTIPAICHLERYYNADVTKELVGTSIPASEHSCMCAGAESYKDLFDSVEEEFNETTQTWDKVRIIMSEKH